MAKPKVAQLDFMRGFAIIMVVILHVSAAYIVYSPPHSNVFYLGLFLNQWSRICLPLFIFVSGFGLFYGYGHKTSLNLRDFYLRRLYTVFTPYLIWSLLYIILRDILNPSFNFIGLGAKEMFLAYISWTFKENIHTPIWFVLLIIQFYFIFPALIGPLTKIKKPRQFIIVNAVIFIIVITYLYYFNTPSNIHVLDLLQDYYSVNLLGWYYYFILGGVVALNWDRFKITSINKYLLTFLYIITTLLVIIEAYAGVSGHGQLYIEKYTSVRPTVVINTLTAIPVIYFIANKVVAWHKLDMFAKNLSRYSFGIFFVHPQVLTFVKWVVGRLYGTYTTRISQLILVFAITIILTYAICFMVDKTPFRTVLMGVGRKK